MSLAHALAHAKITFWAITLLIFHLQSSRSVILDRNGEILLLRASRAFLRFPYLHRRPGVRPGVRLV